MSAHDQIHPIKAFGTRMDSDKWLWLWSHRHNQGVAFSSPQTISLVPFQS